MKCTECIYFIPIADPDLILGHCPHMDINPIEPDTRDRICGEKEK
jgi:hypothetical protein